MRPHKIVIRVCVAILAISAIGAASKQIQDVRNQRHLDQMAVVDCSVTKATPLTMRVRNSMSSVCLVDLISSDMATSGSSISVHPCKHFEGVSKGHRCAHIKDTDTGSEMIALEDDVPKTSRTALVIPALSILLAVCIFAWTVAPAGKWGVSRIAQWRGERRARAMVNLEANVLNMHSNRV